MSDATNPPRPAPTGVGVLTLEPGVSVGRYTIRAVLGQGGFGITYLAHDSQLHRDVAIKEYLPASLAVRQGSVTVLPRSTEASSDFTWGRERFVAEGRTLASLGDAPAIVRVHDFLEANGTAYIVMELVRGVTLEEELRRRSRLSPQEVDAILWPLLDGLQQVHDAGFLHRDIKPANILLRTGGTPTLIDFGASRAAMANRSTVMTAIFTPGYAAAEQMTAAKQGPWTDIYSLSATIYHAITGAPPPPAFDRMLEDQFQPLALTAPVGFSRTLLAGIDAGLQVRGPDRPQSIAEWRMLLAQAAPPGGDATVVMRNPAVAPVPVPARPTTSRTVLYAGVGLAAIVIAAGGYLVFSGKSQPPAVALQDMKAEDLEKALEARRKADAEAAEKRKQEEAARDTATREAEANKAATLALERAQQDRQKAEDELARLKAQIEEQKKTAQQTDIARQEEAQRKAEAEAAESRRIEQAARDKAAAEAEAQRKADDAVARAQAERERAEADVRAKAEAGEASLRLAAADRQRLQLALTSQGFDTRGNDGNFGPRTREMITAWQKARKLSATGFLDGGQHQQLLREAAAALQKYDDDQKRTAEEKKKAEEEARAKATVPPPATPAPAPSAGTFDGAYSGGVGIGRAGMTSQPVSATARISQSTITGELTFRACSPFPFTLSVAPSGQVSGEISGPDGSVDCKGVAYNVSGRIVNDTAELEMRAANAKGHGTLKKIGP